MPVLDETRELYDRYRIKVDNLIKCIGYVLIGKDGQCRCHPIKEEASIFSLEDAAGFVKMNKNTAWENKDGSEVFILESVSD